MILVNMILAKILVNLIVYDQGDVWQWKPILALPCQTRKLLFEWKKRYQKFQTWQISEDILEIVKAHDPVELGVYVLG